jgi:hypothetical protein
MECRNFLEFLQLNEPNYDGLTQMVILMDRYLGCFIGECQAKTLIKISLLQKT